jgi:DNA-binding beta-propeller fold protein YncE
VPSHPRTAPRRTTAVALVVALAAALLALAAPPAAPARAQAPAQDYEIWALDQGAEVNRIHIYSSDLEEVDVIDFERDVRTEPSEEHPTGQRLVDTPHMIDFTSDHAYAFVASTRTGNVTVIRTADRAVLDVIPTGATAHMAAVLPDDSAVWVANIGARTLTEITIDAEAEAFAVGRTLDFTQTAEWQEAFGPESGWAFPAPGPVCHQYTADSRYAYVTFGPAQGGLFVVDLQGESGQPEVERAFPVDEVKANCGVALSADGSKMYANFGLASQDAVNQGEWYVFDTATHELVQTDRSGGGDAHGVRVTPDGSELWMINRQTSDGVVIDTATDEVIDTLEGFGESPDILDFSPDGTRAFITLRGPNPRSGGSAVHPIAGDTPGFAVVDVATRELVEIVQPALDLDDYASSDVHGIGVRLLPATDGPEEPPAAEVTRVSGGDRILTAVGVSAASFDDGTAAGAVLARAGDYPDALTGTPLAVAVGGPVLLTHSGRLPAEVATELTRALAPGSTVHVLGGTAAVSEAVVQAVTELGFPVERHAGRTRFETAIAVAAELRDPEVQLITTGLDFADALSAGAAAGHLGGAVLLTTPDAPHPSTAAYLAANPSEERYAVGGPAARAHADAEPLVGGNRFATAVAVAEALLPDAEVVGLARGDVFADALAGGAHSGALGGPLLLTPSGALHPDVAGYVCARAEQLTGGFAYGGTSALADDVLEALRERLDGEGCDEGFTASALRYAVASESTLVCELPEA